MEWPESLTWSAWFLLHVGGFVAACLSRLSLGLLAERTLQLAAAFGFLSIAAVAVLASMEGGDHLRLWVVSGTTLSSMVIAIVADPVGSAEDPLLAQFAATEERQLS